MCNTCSLGQVKLVTPVTVSEFDEMVISTNANCPECGRGVFNLSEFKYPSLISGWRIITSSSIMMEPIPNIIHSGLMIV